MIATLNLIKSSFEEVLEDEDYPTDFLDQMFTMKMVMTGDNDGSVYLVVDIPEIENFDEIRDYLMETSGGNQAVNFYLSHMVPGKRHYLCVDYDDTFGFTLNNGDASKWLVTKVEDITSVTEVKSEGEIASIAYFNALGMSSSEPFDGVNIVVTRYTDGTKSTKKVLK